MAHRTARLAAATRLGPETRLLELEIEDGSPVGFRGGQYVILDSGVPIAPDRNMKRCYSILARDADQSRLRIAVRRIEGGQASAFFQEAPVGASYVFSGPWGKFYAEGNVVPGRTLVVATDTGITAALALVQSEGFAASRSECDLVWMAESADYFLPEPFVRECATSCRLVSLVPVPPPKHPDRLDAVRGVLQGHLQGGPPAAVFMSGDGAVIFPLKDDLVAGGMASERVLLESFFNTPNRKVAA